jgi:6-pyruvoyltetrahydropterin/6-carboxytetrahydropterin synthase
VELYCDFSFEAAHRLPHMPAAHKCFRLHGHSYRVRIYVRGEPDPHSGMVVDFADVKRVVAPIIEGQLDHRYLNEVAGLENPTAENVAGWIWRGVRPDLPLLAAVEVLETCRCGVIYRGPEHDG